MTGAIVIGGGVGGLAAAIALRQRGDAVTLLEARDDVGGLAGGFDVDGRSHDGGPYILLDRPGLEWAFDRLGTRLADHVDLIALDEIYRVRRTDAPDVIIYRDLARTADELAVGFGPATRDTYLAFVARMSAIHRRLAPLQRTPFGGVRSLLGRGLVREAMFLARGLGAELQASRLPPPVLDALGVWTHIAGQSLADAPAPLALVPALIHDHGAFTVRGGIRRIAEALGRIARTSGVAIRCRAPVTRIVRDRRRVLGVELATGDRLAASLVISNAPGVTTYARLLDPPDPATLRATTTLALQSPGIAAYLHADVARDVPFLQFWLANNSAHCLVHAGAVDDTRRNTLRLVSPIDHGWAERSGAESQRAQLEALLAETWWQGGISNTRVVATRIPTEWGERFHLWRDSMNPTMTSAFMRAGRLAHKSPAADNLYLCGSATHPGQWVSFCAISGVLAVDQI